MKIVGFTGRKRSGKDTAAAIVAGSAPKGASKYAFADPIYDMASVFLGCKHNPRTMDKESVIDPYGVSLRHILQTIGTEWGRDCINPDVWIMHAREELSRVLALRYKPEYFLITDVRFDNEAEFVKEVGGSVIRVVRDVATASLDSHRSELEVSDCLVDRVVRNPAGENPTPQDKEDFKKLILQTVATIYG